MRALEFITESKGVFGRRQNDPYEHTSGKKAYFLQAQVWPDPKAHGTKYDSIESMNQVIGAIEQDQKKQIEWTNTPTNNTLAFGIAEVVTEDGEKLLWGRYFQQSSLDMTSKWGNNNIPAGWKLVTKTSQKETQSNLKPNALIGTPDGFQGAQSIINQVSARTDDPVIVDGLVQTAQGKLAVFPGKANQDTAIRDYLGEIMGPIALMSGLIKNSATEEARKKLAGGASWSKMTISWPQTETNSLIDSEFVAPNGATIGISSKGDAGAKPSIASLLKFVNEVEAAGDTKLMKSTEVARDVIKTIAENNQYAGPLALGVKYGVCSQALANEVEQYRASVKKDLNGVSKEAATLLQQKGYNLEHPQFQAGYAILAGVAKRVEEVINALPAFQSGLSLLLNNSSVVQIYTDVKKKGDDVEVTGFRAVYPPKFEKMPSLRHGKTYYSTGVKGKFTFEMPAQ